MVKMELGSGRPKLREDDCRAEHQASFHKEDRVMG